MDASPQTTAPANPNNNLLHYDGELGKVYLIWIKNLLLTMVTLGIYRAWAKTNMRSYIYNSFSFLGDRFEYTGTGKEIFGGYVKVALLWIGFSLIFTLGLAILLQSLFSMTVNATDVIVNLFLMLFILMIVYFAQYAALRYRLNRTAWRGVRGTLKGSVKRYVLFRMKRLLLNIVTLGFLIGRSDILARKLLVSDMYFGSQKCTFEADDKALDKVNLISLLLFIPTLGISRLWYRAAKMRLFLNGLSAGSVHFKGTHTGGGLLGLWLGNAAIVIFTLGFGTPIALKRTVRFHARHTYILGGLEGTTILQAKDDASALGEGMDDALDADGFDVDLGYI